MYLGVGSQQIDLCNNNTLLHTKSSLLIHLSSLKDGAIHRLEFALVIEQNETQ